jgi:hypothetical protein
MKFNSSQSILNKNLFSLGNQYENNNKFDTQSSFNFIGRVINFIKKDRPLILQIVIKALSILAFIACVFSLVGIPLAYNIMIEYRTQNEETNKTLQEEIIPIISNYNFELRLGPTYYENFLKVQNPKNTNEEFMQEIKANRLKALKSICKSEIPLSIPTYDIGNRLVESDYINFFKVEDLKESLYVGIDNFGRRFITFKVNDKINNKQFVETIFERYKNNPLWVKGGNFGSIFNNVIILNNELKILNEVVTGKNPRFELV